MNTILLIRGKEVSDCVGEMLERENFNAIRVKDDERGFDEELARKPQLLLVDLPLEAMRSQDVFARATNTRTPMIVLSAVSDEEQKSQVLDQGADDYLVKPYSQRELLARIRAVLRRTAARRETTVRFGDVEVNLERRNITRNKQKVEVNSAEYKLLAFFLQNAGRPLTREQILESVWGYESFGTRTVDVHVARLRSKLELNASAPRHIITIHGVGYRFVA